MKTVTAERYHDISCGHRVVGHESKCRHLHGHNYRVHFVCRVKEGGTPLDTLGRVIDFGEIKSKLCMWLEENWDHKFLAWSEDPVIKATLLALNETLRNDSYDVFNESVVFLPFNPTAENLAQYLVEVIAPQRFLDNGIELISCRIEETRKCTASFNLE